MNIDQAFPSKYISAADLQGREVTVRIDRVVMEQLDRDSAKESKPIVYFQGKQKGMVLNKTNAHNIASIYGKETGGWVGQTITLVTAWVDYQGKSVEAIRVRPTRAAAPAAPAQNWQAPPAQIAPPTAAAAPAAPDLDDAIPF